MPPPLKLAIVGAGPSGFYTASRLLSLLPASSPQGKDVEIHMYERLPTPYGLVRYGVAPDHPEVKNCQHKFDELSMDPRFRFFGNISLGSPPTPSFSSDYTYPHALHLPLSALFPYYTSLLLTYGSSLSSPLPNTPHSSSSPSPLANVIPALAFVSWYNGHPAYSHLQPDLKSTEQATIIGQGNVAIDCARLLLKNPESLTNTDIPEPVLEVLRGSSIRHVTAVGRRGPGQVAFTTKEFREMLNLPDVDFLKIDEALMSSAKKVVATSERARTRLLGLMEKGVHPSAGTKIKTFSLGFLKSPKSFNPSPGTSSVGSVSWSHNALLAPPPPPPLPLPSPPSTPPISTRPPEVVARPTGEMTETKTGLVIESVGYRSESLTQEADHGWELPWDRERGRVRNDGGRIVGADGIMIPGMYTAGWVATGPIGVIASTSMNAYSVASQIISDYFSVASTPASSFSSPLAKFPEAGLPVEVAKSTKRIVELKDWERIDQVERERGKTRGKEREKMRTVEEMLEVLN